MSRELLIGCGSTRDYRIGPPERKGGWGELTTLDYEPRHKPDVVWDLRDKPWPFPDDRFDEVHAYEVLEHLGQQGDAEAFFSDFTEIWRVLKPDGYLCATVPWYQSEWAWGDPSHTRIITPGSLVFLSQAQYRAQIGVTPMSDFRSIYSADFETVGSVRHGESMAFVLKVVKDPSRQVVESPDTVAAEGSGPLLKRPAGGKQARPPSRPR